MVYKPFRPNLAKVSREEIRLLEAIHSYLPATGVREGLFDGMRRAIADEVGESLSIRLESVVQEGFSRFAAKLPKHPLVAVVGLAPLGERLLCEIDSTLAMLAVEKMLGGKAKSMPEVRSLSDTEQGVMQYLFARVLAGIHDSCGGAERLHFRLERLALTDNEVTGLIPEGASCAVLAFRVALGRHAGFVRLVFPEPFVAQSLMDIVAPGEERPQEQELLRERLGRYGYVRTSLWAEAGRTTVLPADLAQLEEGDVILLEGGDLALSGGFAGRTVLRVGVGLESGLDAEVSLKTGRALASITGVHRGE